MADRSAYTNDLNGAQSWNQYVKNNPNQGLQADDLTKYNQPGTTQQVGGRTGINSNPSMSTNTSAQGQTLTTTGTGQVAGPAAPTTSPIQQFGPAPKQVATNEFNKDYIPTDTTDPVFSGSFTDKQKQWLQANYLDKLFPNQKTDRSRMTLTDEDDYSLMKSDQAKDKSYLDSQIDAAVTKSRAQTAGAQAGVGSTLGAVNREGTMSPGNQSAAQDAIQQYGADQSTLEATYQKQKDDLAKAQANGDVDAVKTLSNNVQATQKALLTSANENAQKTMQFMGQISDMANNGFVMPPQMMAQYSKQFNIPLDGLMQFNTVAKQINDTKGLDQQQKQAALDKAKQDLQDQTNHVQTAAAQNSEYLKSMYASGADPKTIAAFKAAANIPDYDDPMQKAELNMKQSQAEIERKKSLGIPISAEDRLNEAKALDEMSYMTGGVGGSDSAYVPNQSLEGINVTVDKGSYNITAPPDKEFQCGAFVNRAWGLPSGAQGGFPSLGADKMAIVDNRGVKSTDITNPSSQIKPGMAFVMPIANNKYDHVGIVKQVFPDGTFTTIEANANGKATTDSVGPGKSNITSRTLDSSQVYGFVPPPSGKTQTVGKPQQNYNNYLEEAKAQGLPYAAAKKYAEDKALEGLSSGGPEDTSPVLSSVPKEYRASVTQKADQFDGEQQVKTYQTVQTMKNKAESVDDNTQNPQDDQLLVYTFAKAMDPSSAVREGEYDTVQKFAQTRLQSMGVNAERFYSNSAFLTPDARKNIKEAINKAYDSEKESYDQVRNQYVSSINNLAGKDVGDKILQDYTTKSKPKSVTLTPTSQQSIDQELNRTYSPAIAKLLTQHGVQSSVPSGSLDAILQQYQVSL